MSEIRRDLLSERWVIIAENRLRRPDEFRSVAERRVEGPCPFCAGHEQETPPAIAVYPPEAKEDARERTWQVRVVPNKYPALTEPPNTPRSLDESTDVVAGQGVHEVIIESPRHVVSLAELTDEEVELTFSAYQDRLNYWREHSNLAYGLVFKNARAAGGATLEHAHSQLIVVPALPAEVAHEASRVQEVRSRTGECIFCERLRRELADGSRVLFRTEHFAAYCPFASRFPFETWVLPCQHAIAFEELGKSSRRELAHVVRSVIQWLESAVRGTAYNYWIHTAPWDKRRQPDFHWHIEIAARMGRLAGFELGTGWYINPIPPEDAANRLRAARARGNTS